MKLCGCTCLDGADCDAEARKPLVSLTEMNEKRSKPVDVPEEALQHELESILERCRLARVDPGLLSGTRAKASLRLK